MRASHCELYKQTNKMHFLYVLILQFLYNSTCFERPFRSSSGVYDLLYSAALYKPCRGRDSSVGIATRYGLDGPGIESRWRWDFLHPSRPALGPTQPPIQWVPGISRGLKRSGRGVDHLSPSSAEVEGRVELYLNSPAGPSWPVIGRTLPLPLPLPSCAHI